MKAGQRVRVRAASPIAKRDDVAPNAVGTVLCCYKVRARTGSPDRVDVKFSETSVMWGVAANEFEEVDEGRQFA
ncbi:MAG TPA: hypothetical protein PKA55_06915 [Rhodoblastus sp.]|nr:hypothetical protein [Rhodoblastus sp.]